MTNRQIGASHLSTPSWELAGIAPGRVGGKKKETCEGLGPIVIVLLSISRGNPLI
jgi:hypothetical protein